MEKVVASKQLRLAVETEEERRARLENDAVTKRLRLAMETDKERKARLEKMIATAQLMLALIKGVVDVGVVLSLIAGSCPHMSHPTSLFFVFVLLFFVHFAGYNNNSAIHPY